MGMTTPHALHWDILRWNFEVEHVDIILGHNVEYRGSLLWLPRSSGAMRYHAKPYHLGQRLLGSVRG